MPNIQFPAIVNLTNLNGFNGFKLDSEAPPDKSGYSVNSVGDINGDRWADLVIGAPYCFGQAGCSYVVFGGPGVGSGGVLSPFSLNGVNGFTLYGEGQPDYSGYSVSSAGDINGDGWVDLLIGAYGHNSNTGRSYVVFGGSSVGSGGELVLSSLNGVNGFKLDGEATNDNSGWSVSSAGDINGDGWTDLLIGAPYYNDQAGRSYVVFCEVPPVLQNNRLVIHQGETLGINAALLNATDVNYPPNQVNFIISQLQHGQFQLAPSNTPILQFNEQNLLSGQVFFAHDNSAFAPAYQVSVRDPFSTSAPPVNATVTFYRRPVLVNNELSINQGQTLLITSAQLSVTDDYPSSQVLFTVTNLQHGQFLLAPLNASVTQFTEQQLLAGQVIFAQDCSVTAPSYQIGVSDGYFTLPAASAVITFTSDTAPTLVNNRLIIASSQVILLGATSLFATDILTPQGQLVFTISNLAHGYFAMITAAETAITNFTQQQVMNGQIQFTQDGTNNAPAYAVTVTDECGLSTGPNPAQITFNAASSSSGSNNTVRNAIIGGVISGVLSLGFFGLRLFISRRAAKQLEAMTEGEGVGKEQADFHKNVIRPVAKKILERIQLAGCMGYVSEATSRDAIDAVTALVRELGRQGVNMNLVQMEAAERSHLLTTIARQTKRILVPEVGCCSTARFARFFCAEVTPAQLEANVVAIAGAVKAALAGSSSAHHVELETLTSVGAGTGKAGFFPQKDMDADVAPSPTLPTIDEGTSVSLVT